jgi:hypothetical protein
MYGPGMMYCNSFENYATSLSEAARKRESFEGSSFFLHPTADTACENDNAKFNATSYTVH